MTSEHYRKLRIAPRNHYFLELFLDFNSSVQRNVYFEPTSPQLNDTAVEHLDEVVDGRENVVRDQDLWWGMNNGG